MNTGPQFETSMHLLPARRPLPILLVISLTGVMCSPAPGSLADVVTSEDPYAVAFRVNHIGLESTDSLKFIAHWTDGNDHSRFKVTMNTPAPKDDSGFSFGRGWIIAHGPSTARGLISRIAAIHEVKDTYAPREPVDSIPMTVGILGRGMSRATQAKGNVVAGFFTDDPPGNWLCTKLFLDETDEGGLEIFLHVNLNDSIAEFAVKDPAYGPDLLSVLASVFEAR